MLHMVQAQQSQYILAQADVMAFAFAALGSIEFVEPPHTTAGLIPYSQLFDELSRDSYSTSAIVGVCTHTHICNITSHYIIVIKQ